MRAHGFLVGSLLVLIVGCTTVGRAGGPGAVRRGGLWRHVGRRRGRDPGGEDGKARLCCWNRATTWVD